MFSELELLYQALHSPPGLGIVVRTSNYNSALARLYKARKESGDGALDCLQLRRSPTSPESEIWIVRGGPLDDARAEGNSPKSLPGPEGF